MLGHPKYLRPNWPLPKHIHAATTTSVDHFNLATHVDDDPARVAARRARLKELLKLPAEPHWLHQTHGTLVLPLTAGLTTESPPEADASFTRTPGVVCAVLTADCLPILVYDPNIEAVAAIHGGWRGLHGGIIERTLTEMGAHTDSVTVWLGPAISSSHYPVGHELFETFCDQNPNYRNAFTADGDKWRLDIAKIATLQLERLGVRHTHLSGWCTYAQPELFFSYRRDGKKSGRMATLIWISQE